MSQMNKKESHLTELSSHHLEVTETKPSPVPQCHATSPMAQWLWNWFVCMCGTADLSPVLWRLWNRFVCVCVLFSALCPGDRATIFCVRVCVSVCAVLRLLPWGLWNRFMYVCVSDSVRPHRRQPTRLLCPWSLPGKNTNSALEFTLAAWISGLAPEKKYEIKFAL